MSKKLPRKPAGAAAGRLAGAIVSGNIFHAYLFEGHPEDTEALASWFAAAALCERQDGSICGVCPSCRQIADGISPFIVRVRTEADADAPDTRFTEKTRNGASAKKSRGTSRASKKNASGKIRDAQIEDVITRSMRSSLSGSRVFTIIEKAETITARGQNRLLKTLEEPPEGITIILLTSNSEALLDTIRSRCLAVRADGGAAAEVPGTPKFQERAVRTAADILKGVPAFRLWKDIDYFAGSREYAENFCSIAEIFFRDIIICADPRSRGLEVLKNFENEIIQTLSAVDISRAVSAAGACVRAERDISAGVSSKHALRTLVFSIQLNLK